jgi:uncharacterized membrane protein YccC
MLVLAIGAQTPQYSIERILETIIGAVAGLVINALIVPPVLVAPARLAVGRLEASVASSLQRLSAALRSPVDSSELEQMMTAARELRPLQAKAAGELDCAEESLTFNPRGARHKITIEQDRALLGRLSTLVTRTIGMTRAVRDNYDPALVDDATVSRIALELDRAAHDVRLMAGTVGGAQQAGVPSDPVPITAELPALTAPLVIATPNPRNWVLVGSLLEDLRRVREEIIGGPDV